MVILTIIAGKYGVHFSQMPDIVESDLHMESLLIWKRSGLFLPKNFFVSIALFLLC